MQVSIKVKAPSLMVSVAVWLSIFVDRVIVWTAYGLKHYILNMKEFENDLTQL